MATALAVSTALSLCGCSSIAGDDVTKYPLVESMTTQEAMDYYAESLQYDAVITRTTDAHEEEYELRPVNNEEKAEKVRSLVAQAEQILGSNEYPSDVDGVSSIVTEETYDYIKATLDDLVLSNGEVGDIQQALGFYFVDVTYDISPKTPGTFNQLTPYIGINGAFQLNALGDYSVSSSYMLTAVKKLNEYYLENRIASKANFDTTTGELTVEDGEIPTSSTLSLDRISNNTETEEGTEEDAEGSNEDVFEEPDLDAIAAEAEESEEDDSDDGYIESTETENNDSEEAETPSEENESDSEATENENEMSLEEQYNIQQTESGVTYQSLVSSERKPSVSVKLINNVVGSSKEQSAFLPDLDLVYNKPEAEGTISGFGIYPSGENGLKLFGFDRSKLGGKATLRYIFKESVAGNGELVGYNIYVSDIDVSTGFTSIENNVLIPEFLQGQLEQIVERADRINIDCNLPGYLEGSIYEDMGFGVLRGYTEVGTNRLKYMSVIRSVLSRDSVNNAYLCELETTVQEGSKSSDVYGTYRDKSYVVIQQQGDEFTIIDALRVSRQVYKEPTINPDSVLQKRLIALNLSGDVTDANKTEITQLMNDFYLAGTVKLISGPKDLEVNGETKTVERGLSDCINNDTEMVSTSTQEYMLSEIKNELARLGTGVDSEYMGAITQWIGGYDNQAEITTEEFIEYSGKGEGLYIECYYLVSKMHDTWVIDERKVINSEMYEGAEVDNIRARFE